MTDRLTGADSHTDIPVSAVWLRDLLKLLSKKNILSSGKIDLNIVIFLMKLIFLPVSLRIRLHDIHKNLVSLNLMPAVLHLRQICLSHITQRPVQISADPHITLRIFCFVINHSASLLSSRSSCIGVIQRLPALPLKI